MEDAEQSWRLTDRRSLLLKGAAVGAGAIGASHLLTAPPASASGRLTKGDVAIVQFLAAAELLEADLWEQHNELGGIQDSERPGGSGEPGLHQSSLGTGRGHPQYIPDNAAGCCTARAHASGRRWRSTWTAEHITCQEVVELVTDYLERALPADETSLFEQHIDFCDGCKVYVEQMRTTVATVGRVTEEDVPPETRERLVTAFREWKR